MDTVWQDIRYAARMLAKKPGFTAVAVLSLGLGIGANTTIFTLVKAVFLQSVPVQDPSRVVAFFSDAQNKNGLTQYLGSSYLNLKDYREKNDVFSGLSIAMATGAELDISGAQIGVFAELVNWDFFDIVGVHPSIGRGFLPEEDQTPGAHPVVVLSHAIWNRQFGANPKLIGQTIRVSNQDYTVIGVMPEQFHDVGQLGSPDMLIPIMMHDQILTGPSKEYFFWRRFRMAPAVARLKPGITLARAEAAMRLLGDELEKEYPNDNGGRNNMMVPFDQTNIPPQQRSVFLLAGTLMMSIVGLVLLIACANVANLLLTRATQRRRELAVRLSLGASRSRLIRQLLTESLLLGLVACGAGVLIGHWLERLILGLWPGGPPRNLDFTMDLRVLGFTVALSLVATMIFGLVPALQASKPSQMASLRDRSDAPAGSTHWYGLRGALVMTQVALSLIALVGAGLFVHSMRNAQNVDPGFEVKHEMILLLNVGNAHYTQAHGEQYYKEVVDRVDGLPMVTNASLSDDAPFGGSLAFTIIPEGSDYNDPRNGRTTPMAAVGPDFFRVAGIGFVRGRDFTDHDDAQSMRVAIVNEAMAKQMWPDEDPIGKRFRILGQTTDIQTVGIVKTVKYATLGEPPQPIFYLALKQQYSPAVWLYVHTRGDAKSAVSSVRSTVQTIDPGLPLRAVRTVSETLDNILTLPRMGAELLGAFGLLALALAAIGTYGVMSYSVSQRTQEIGLRMALGAQPRDVVWLIVGGGMAMVLCGVLAGLIFSSVLAHSMSSLLYGIGFFDAPSFFSTALLLVFVALIACWLPARRAMHVDPMIALHHE